MSAKAREWTWLLVGATALGASWAYGLGAGPVTTGHRAATLTVPVVANGSGRLDVGGPSDQVTVLEFFASWCGACSKAVPRAERAALGTGARWIAVSVDASAAEAAAAATDWRLGGTVVHDDGRRLHDAYQIRAVPSLVVLRPDGSVSFSASGFVSEPELAERIEEARGSAGRASGILAGK